MAGEAEKVFHSQLNLLYTLDSDEEEEEEAHVEAVVEACAEFVERKVIFWRFFICSAPFFLRDSIFA